MFLKKYTLCLLVYRYEKCYNLIMKILVNRGRCRVMDIGRYVIVTNKDCNLFRRRCRVVSVIEDGYAERIELYSEGLEEKEVVKASDCEVSKF